MERFSKHTGFLALVYALAMVMTLMLPHAFGEEKEKKLDGKSLFEQKCLQCHKPQKFRDQHNSRKDWELILRRMKNLSCALSDDEIVIMSEYLEKEHGE